MLYSDEAIVHAITNPNEPFGSSIRLDSEVKNYKSCSFCKPFNEGDERLFELLNREREAIKQAEEGQLNDALKTLNDIICDHKDYASAYNNRAQIKQLLQDREGALEDLNCAIGISKGKGAVAALALTQRGCLHRFEGHDDLFLKDLEEAAALGNPIAKKLVVQLNPYAALCNDMLTVMLQKCVDGEQMYS